MKQIILVFCLYFATTLANEVCVKKAGCKCQQLDGRGIDLSNVMKDTYISTPEQKNKIYFASFCENIIKFPSDLVLANNTVNTCTSDKSGYSLCVYDSEKKTVELLGRTTDESFHSSPDSNQFLIYTLNNQKSFVSLVCVTGFEKSTLYIDPSNDNQTNLILYSQYACLQQLGESEYLSTGAVLLILVSVTFSVYLIGGILLRYFFLGARGQEVLPNIDFWKGLPSLVRDGVRFIQNGCRVLPSPDDSYDAI